MTNKEMYEMIIAMAQGQDVAEQAEEIVAFAQKKIAQIANKSNYVDGKKLEEQERFLDTIRDVLVENDDANGMQCSTILKDSRINSFEWTDGKTTTSQRLTAMIKKLVDAGDVIRTVEKKVSYFKLA